MIPTLLLSSVGRWASGALVAFSLIGGAYVYGYVKGRNYERLVAASAEAERVKNAVRSGDDARDNPDRVRELDKRFCRDCE
jgi:hypothetical protein